MTDAPIDWRKLFCEADTRVHDLETRLSAAIRTIAALTTIKHEPPPVKRWSPSFGSASPLEVLVGRLDHVIIKTCVLDELAKAGFPGEVQRVSDENAIKVLSAEIAKQIVHRRRHDDEAFATVSQFSLVLERKQ